MTRWVGALARTGQRARRIARAVFAAFVAVSTVSVLVGEPARPAAAEDSGAPFEIAGRVPLFDGNPTPGVHEQDGWLIINPGTRRGYQFFRVGTGSARISSFDLDTLLPLRSVVFPDLTIGGACGTPPCSTAGAVGAPGDLHNAVDEQNGKIYFAGLTPVQKVGALAAGQQLTIAELDEAKFEAGNATPIRHMRVPLTQPELVDHDLMGFDLVKNGQTRKLLLLFSNYPATSDRKIHEHWLAQWDVANGTGDWTYFLQACTRAPLVFPDNWAWELPILRGKEAIYIPCQATQGVAQAVRIPINGGGIPDPDVSKQEAFPLPRAYGNAFADPASERLIFQTDQAGSGWWVFDGKAKSWVGAVGASLWSGYPVSGGIDQTTGRLYQLVPDHAKGLSIKEAVQGGFGYSDIRLTPAPQARVVMPELDYPGQFRILVDPAAPDRDRRIFLRRGNRTMQGTPNFPGTANDQSRPVEREIIVIRDRQPIPSESDFEDIDNLTIDRPEQDGVTESSFNGAARGFGSRVLLTGGFTAMGAKEIDENAGDLLSKGQPNTTPPLIHSCYRNDRELVFGTGEARVSDLTTSARSVALHADESTKADLGQPGSRCPAPGTQAARAVEPKAEEASGKDVGETLGQQPEPEPEPGEEETDPLQTESDTEQFLAATIDSKAGQQWDSNGDNKDDYTASCSGDEGERTAHLEKSGQDYDAKATCGQSTEAASTTANASVEPKPELPIHIADSSVTTEVKRDPEKGIVSTVTSTVHGLTIAGVGTVDLIQAKATSRANGRPIPQPTTPGAPKVPATTFTRKFCGATLPNFVFPGCTSDPSQMAQFVKALNLVLGRNGEARLRDPDPRLQAGTPGGYQAAIQRDPKQAFTDRFVTRDDSNAVPAFELIFYRNDSGIRGAGRQIFQFAGVEASSTYAIKCLLGKRADGKDCNTPAPPDPANLTIKLTDQDDEPLKGGVFKVHKDVDGNGELGIDDPVIANGNCATDDDGTGNCHWEGLDPGDYVIEQASAPAGYAEAEDLGLVLIEGLHSEVQFFNVRSVGGIVLGLTDDADGKPLPGGSFELYQDDGDGMKSPADRLYATCTSDPSGLCEFELPAGSAQRAAAADPALPCMGQTEAGTIENDPELVDAIRTQLGDVLGGGGASTDGGGASTDSAEVCVAEVPLGNYIVHQSAAPEEYAAASDLPLQLDLPGELALLMFTNGLSAIEGKAGTAAAGSDGTAASSSSEPETIVVDEGSPAPAPIVSTSPIGGDKGPLRRALDRILAAPASAVRFLFSNPRELGLMAAVWALIWAPCYLAERRRVLRSLRDRSTQPIGASVA